MRKVLPIALVLALCASIAPASAASKQMNSFAVTQKIIYVGLTPTSEPNFWTSQSEETTTANVDGDQLAFVKTVVSNATTFWKKTSANKLKFGTPTFFIGKPGTALKRCNSEADVKLGLKVAGLKSIPLGAHLIVANVFSDCGYAGLGEMSGNSVHLRSLSSGTLTHELGHNFGFRHSGSISCTNSDFTKFGTKSCLTDEYGDFRDLMGNDDWCPNATLSATQRAITFGTPLAKDLKLGIINTVDESRGSSSNLVYQIKYKGIWYFFEYYNPGRDLCMFGSDISTSAEVQVRMLSPEWTGPMVISRRENQLPQLVIPREGEGAVVIPPYGGWVLRGFKAGEKFQLPGTNLMLKVLTTETGTATFSVSNG